MPLLAMVKEAGVPVILVLLTLGASATIVLANNNNNNNNNGSQCTYDIVQSMPDGLDLKDPPGVLITHESLLEIISNAKKTLSIASFYLWLTAPSEFDGHPSVEPGRKLMQAIVFATERGVKVEVVLDRSGRKDMSNPEDVSALQKVATVKFLNMTRLLGAGVVHSKYMIADNETFYVGSSNFDWRSYTQIKEIGMTFKSCPELARDMDKLFRTYMLMADEGSLPDKLSDDFKTTINLNNPMLLDDIKLFLAGSPPAFNNPKGEWWTGRTDDIDGLLHILNKARHRIDISVMNYSPSFEFGWPRRFWPRIDNALRRAAIERRVKVRLLFSDWSSTKPLEIVWYKSLNALQSKELRGGGIHVKLLKVPAFDDYQKRIPFARVKHDKYMVTEQGLYIGTSNWTPDYFTNTCGVGVVIEPSGGGGNQTTKPGDGKLPRVITTMQDIFERDFNSQYAHELV